MENSSDGQPVSVRVLVPDGGELEAPEADQDEEPDDDAQADDAEQGDGDGDGEGSESDAEASEEDDVSDGDEETDDDAESDEEDETGTEEDEREESEREAAVADDGTRVLHLNLDGLFLDLLGLEVDLDEVTLDLTARTGEGKLVGNLLSAVSGLLDGSGLGSLLGGGSDDGDGGSMFGLPSLPDLPNPMDRARELAGALADRVRSMVGSAIAALPLQELFSQFLRELVSQLLESEDDDTDDDADAASA